MKGYFITGTGTGVGKTLIACALAHQRRLAGTPVRLLKPIASGFDPERPAGSDPYLLLRAGGKQVTENNLEAISPWRFLAPLSPDIAAEEEGRRIEWDGLLGFCRSDSAGDCTIVEGVGGVMTPLDDRHTVLDWMAALALPVVLVSGTYLGALTHTLTACHAILTRSLALQAVVLNASENASVSAARTGATLARFLPKGTHVALIPRLAPADEMWKMVPSLLEVIP